MGNDEKKAQELIGLFTEKVSGECEKGCENILFYSAKECSIIVIDEVMSSLCDLDFDTDGLVDFEIKNQLEFWNSVKNILNKKQNK